MIDRALYSSGRHIVSLYTKIMLKKHVVFHAPFPDGPKIIVLNHPTTSDPFIMTTLLSERASILIQGAIFKVPLFGAYLHISGHVPVNIEHGTLAFTKARALLKKGRTVIVFIEGDISPSEGGYHRPHTGAVRLALQTGAPIIPVGVGINRRHIKFLRATIGGKKDLIRWYLSGPYAITVGDRFVVKGDVENRAHVRQLSLKLMDQVIALSCESNERVNTITVPFIKKIPYARFAYASVVRAYRYFHS